jgi:hypothetical protein
MEVVAIYRVLYPVYVFCIWLYAQLRAQYLHTKDLQRAKLNSSAWSHKWCKSVLGNAHHKAQQAHLSHLSDIDSSRVVTHIVGNFSRKLSNFYIQGFFEQYITTYITLFL